MKKSVFNPYLPEGLYLPDGEPHVFGDRVYVYASHDRYNARRYCPGDYEVWSAPVTDLSDWSCKGVSYPRRGERNRLGIRCMWAPDCVRGLNGKYYLYYCFGFDNRIHVAEGDEPDGPFRFYGCVRHRDGVCYGAGEKDIMCFDPAVLLDDDGQLYLYSGYSANEDNRRMLRLRGINNVDGTGNQVVRLENDMVTVAGEPRMLIPGYQNSAGTGFEGHEMYEASSIRKIGGRYYFIYSSRLSHELCYAVSQYPDRGFAYGGTLISNGDIGYDGRSERDALNYWGNIHGSIERIDGQWYVFYHRQTNKNEQSRQGCAELIEIAPDGGICQAEMTSQGLTGKPLPGEGVYPAYIACNLKSKYGAVKCAYGPFQRRRYRIHPCIAEYQRGRQCIKGMRDGSTAGFKYFDLGGTARVTVTVRGGAGTVAVKSDLRGRPAGMIELINTGGWQCRSTLISLPAGKTALYFTYIGKGKIDFLSFRLERC